MKILFNQNIYNQCNNFTNKYNNYASGISFRANPIKFVNDLLSKNDNFSPKYSIIEDKDGYIGDVGTHLSKLPKNERAAEARRLYSHLDSPQEKSAFKKYFGEYIPTEQQQQPSTDTSNKDNNAASTRRTIPKRNKKSVNNKEHETVDNKKLETKPLTRNELYTNILNNFNLLKSKDEVPQFVAKIATGSKIEQQELARILDELNKEYRVMYENDPRTIFRKENFSKLFEEIRLRPEYQGDHDIFEPGKVCEKEMEELLKQNGLENLQPETSLLGQKLAELEKQMQKHNLSFLPNITLTQEDLADEEKIAKKFESVGNYMYINEASALDGLDWMEKNGEYAKDIDFAKYDPIMQHRMTLPDVAADSIILLTDTGSMHNEDGTWSHGEDKMTDKVLNKYITGVYKKFAKNETIWETDCFPYGDASSLDILFEKYARKMSKETAFKYLEALEKTGNHSDQAYTFKLWADTVDMDKESIKEFVKRAEALEEKLPECKKKLKD